MPFINNRERSGNSVRLHMVWGWLQETSIVCPPVIARISSDVHNQSQEHSTGEGNNAVLNLQLICYFW